MLGPIDAHKAELARLFASGKFADCSIKCGSYEVQIHKAIISAQSEYLSAAFSRDSFREGQENQITLLAANDPSEPDNGGDDPDIVKLMVKYFYTLDYTTPDDVFFRFGARPSTSLFPKPQTSTITPSQTHLPSPSLFSSPAASTTPPNSRPSTSLCSAHAVSTTASSPNTSFSLFGPTPAIPRTPAATNPASPNPFPQPSKPAPAEPQRAPIHDGDGDGNSKANTNLPTHAKIFALAVKYQIPALQALAAEKFARAAERGWDHETFAGTIALVYSSTAEEVKGLRSVVVETLLAHDPLFDKPEVESAVCDISTLAYQLLKRKRRV